MFLKLVKHELHAVYRLLLPLFGGLLFMALLARASIWLVFESNADDTFHIIGLMFLFLFILACIAAIVLTMVLMMVRFAKSVHGDEGYLTNTLPVGIHSILLSRLLVSFLALLSAYAAVYLGYRICTLNVSALGDFRKGVLDMLSQMGMYDKWAVPKFALTMLVAMLTSILQIFAAICIGHSFSKSKAGMSILFYFVLYFAMQMINSFVMVNLLSLLRGSITDSISALRSTTTYAIISNAIYGVVFYFLSWIMLRKKLNLA